MVMSDFRAEDYRLIRQLLQKNTKFPTKLYQCTHHTLRILLHCLGKLKNKKFCTFRARRPKTCFKCDFLSSMKQIYVIGHKNNCKG